MLRLALAHTPFGGNASSFVTSDTFINRFNGFLCSWLPIFVARTNNSSLVLGRIPTIKNEILSDPL